MILVLASASLVAVMLSPTASAGRLVPGSLSAQEIEITRVPATNRSVTKILPTPPFDYAWPGSLADLVSRAEITALVRVRSRSFVKLGAVLHTHYELEPIETFRSRGRSLPRTIDAYQPGGIIEVGSEVINYLDGDFRRLIPGSLAVVSLDWQPRVGGYYFTYGANGVFEFLLEPGMTEMAGTVRTQSRKPEIARVTGQSIGEFLQTMRALGGGG